MKEVTVQDTLIDIALNPHSFNWRVILMVSI